MARRPQSAAPVRGRPTAAAQQAAPAIAYDGFGGPPPEESAAPAAPSARDQSLERKQRRFRQLEENHRQWQEQVQKELRRQKAEIEALKKDNEPLKQRVNELRAAEATSSSRAAGLASSGRSGNGLQRNKELDAKRDAVAHLESRIKEQKERIEALDQAMENLRGQIKDGRRGMGGVDITKESHDAINRQVAVLENRLDHSLVQFNDVLRQNKELRDQIDTLRGEREVFDSIYRQLEAELQEKKKEMAFVIEVSNIAYEERDNNAQVLNNLKTFAADEMASFAETFKELDDLLEEDRKMKEQVKLRLAQLEKKERALLDEDEKTSSVKKKLPLAANANRPGSSGGAASGAGGQGGGLSSASDGQKSEQSAASLAQQYEDIAARIRQATDIPDLNEIVKRFINAEEDNFSLFAYVNDLGKEIELLEKQRSALMDEIDALTLGKAADQDRRQRLRELEGKLRSSEGQAQRFTELSTKTESTIRSVMAVVEQMFVRLDCDESTIVERHGIAGMTMENVTEYLAAVERKTDELLAAWARQNGADAFTVSRGPQVPFDSMQLQVDPKRLPSTGEDADGSDDDSHPMSREELLARAQRRLQASQQAVAEKKMVRGSKPKTAGAAPLKK